MKKVECLQCLKQHYSYRDKEKIKTYIDVRIIPVQYINTVYGSVSRFIECEKGRIFEADSYTIIQSNEYDEKYLKYINTDSKILKAIDILRKNDNIVNKEDVLNYLLDAI